MFSAFTETGSITVGPYDGRWPHGRRTVDDAHVPGGPDLDRLHGQVLDWYAVHRRDLVPGHPHYTRLDGGLPADAVTARLVASRP